MTETPESQQAALKPCPKCKSEFVRLDHGGCESEIIAVECGDCGYTQKAKTYDAVVAKWNGLKRAATPVDVSHAALVEEVADAIYSGGGYGNSGQKAWRLNKTEDEMTDCLHIAQRAIQATLRAHPAEEEKCECGAMSKQDCNDLPSLRHCGGATDSAHPAGGVSRETAAEVLVHYDGFLGEKTPFHPDTSLQERRSMRIACMENALRAAGIGAGVVQMTHKQLCDLAGTWGYSNEEAWDTACQAFEAVSLTLAAAPPHDKKGA